MESNLKVCPACKTVNDEQANFCRQCGKEFEQVAKEPEVQVETEAEPVEATVEEPAMAENTQPEENKGDQVATLPVADSVAENNQNNENYEPEFDTQGVNEAEFAAYIGKNQNNFLPSFRQFCMGKKVSFSPLVFLLSWLISPIVGAFWFFHRKINKIGAIVLSIGIVLTVISGAVSVAMVGDMAEVIGEFAYNIDDDAYTDYDYQQNSYSPVADFYGEDYDEFYDEYYDEYFDEYGDDISNEEVSEYLKGLFGVISKYSIWTTLLNLINIAFAVILGIFAKYFYFKDAADKILSIKQKNPTPSSINDIAAAGGTSSVIWIICLVGYILASIIFVVALIVSMVSQIMIGMF